MVEGGVYRKEVGCGVHLHRMEASGLHAPCPPACQAAHPTPVHTAHPTPVHIARPPRFQLRCVLQRPLRVTRPGVLLEGELVLEAHERQSYWVHLSLSAPPAAPGQAVQQVDEGT